MTFVFAHAKSIYALHALENLKWARDNDGVWANNTAKDGNLEILKWISVNGGEWTSWTADCAAKNGHLETLKWIGADLFF